MMRSFLYLLFPLTTTTIVATLSLAESLGEAGSGANEFQSTIYTPSTDNSEGNLLDDSAALVGLDNDIPSLRLGNEEAQTNNENGGACSGSKSINRKRRRGNGENNYCSPTDAPAPASPSMQFRPHSQQEEGAGTEGSSTRSTSTDQKGGSGSSSQPGLQPGTEGDDMLQLAPWSSTQNSCPENRPVAVCAGAQLLPYGPNPGWQWIPFSDLPPPPEELFYWPYCRLCTFSFRPLRPTPPPPFPGGKNNMIIARKEEEKNINWVGTFNSPCKTELRLELFMCCGYFKKNVNLLSPCFCSLPYFQLIRAGLKKIFF